MRTPHSPVVKFKEEMRVFNGHWWARVDNRDADTQTWAPIGKVEKMPPMEAAHCARLARWYNRMGLLPSLTGPVVTFNDNEILSVERFNEKVSW
jgi:hypothetical protein